MNAVFCSLNSQYIHSSLAPWCLLAGVQRWGNSSVTATVVEGTINEPISAVIERLVERRPDAVGFCCYIWNITQVCHVMRELKRRLPACFIFVGGPEVSYCAENLLREEKSIDAVVAGEGEYPVACLLNALSRGESPVGLPGVSCRVEGEYHIAAPYLTEEEPPSPYVPAYFEALQGRIAYLETSRGCPYSCAFCLSGRCGGVRYYPLERVWRELLLLANSGAQTVKLVDRTFNADRHRARQIFRFLMDHAGKDIPDTVCFHFEIAGDLLDEETITLLSEAPAGLFQMEIGLQSFHAPTLEAIKRHTNVDTLVSNIRKLVSCGNIHVHIDLIAGLPEENLPTFIDGFNKAIALRPHMLQLGFLKLLHGAAMREEPSQYPCTYTDTPPYEVRETPWMSEADLAMLRQVEDALDRLYNSGRFRRTMTYVMKAANMTAFEVLQLAAPCSAGASETLSLDTHTERLYACFSSVTGVNTDALRDVMVCDRLSANPGGLLPACLQRFPDRVKLLKKAADSDPRFARPTGVRRGAACLSDGQVLVYADQCDRHPVTGLYPLRYFEQASLERAYQVVLFDLDGTITDPLEGIADSLIYALKHFGIEVRDKRELHRFIGPPLMDSFRKFYGLTEPQCRQAIGLYREYYAQTGIYQSTLYEGIPELLRDLQRHGYRVLVATSKPEMYARRIFDEYGLTPYFDVIAGSDIAEKRANKAQVVAYALEQAKLTEAHKAIMVGDTPFDVNGARECGLPCVGVLYGYGGKGEMEEAQPAYLVESVSALRRLFLEDI